MRDFHKRSLLLPEREKELIQSQEDWKYLPQSPYPSTLLQQPYPKGYEAPSFVLFDGRKGSPKEHVNRFIDALGPHEDLASRFCKKYFKHEERVTTTQLNNTRQKHGEDPMDFVSKVRDLALDCYDEKDEEALVEICISNIVAEGLMDGVLISTQSTLLPSKNPLRRCGKGLLCAGFPLRFSISLLFLVYSRSPVGILASNVGTYSVGAGKEGLASVFWGFVTLPRLVMASADLSLIMRDHLYSLDDRLKRGRPPPLLKSADEDIIIDGETASETTPVGWSEWVDRELNDPSTCDVLNRARVLDAILISKACDIHIEAKMLRHVVRRWRNKLKLKALWKGAPTSPSTSVRFSNWIQLFGDVNRNEPYCLVAFVSLWLRRFLFCDFSQDCLHEHVFPLALAIARGSVLALAPMFLGHLYRLLDQVQLLEKGAAGTMTVETFLNSNLLQVFLWERFKGIEVSPLPYSKDNTLADSEEGSYVPEGLPSICKWSRRMQRKGQNFLELLDDVESFIFRLYCPLLEGFRHIALYADSDDLVEAQVMTAQGRQLRRETLLSTACLPLPTLGDDHLEVSVHYSPYQVRR
ncbi:unnamed protein product [Prunus armeniaca]